MRAVLFFLELAIASILFCFANGANKPFTPEEDRFIVNQLEARVGVFERDIWKDISKAHDAEVIAKTDGFSTPRPARKIRRRFVRSIRRNRAILLTDALKKQFKKLGIPDFSPAEEDFINDVLITWEGSLQGDAVWIEMARRHAQRRLSGDSEFAKERTAKDLFIHFRGFMRTYDLIDRDIKRKFFQQGAGPSDTARSEDEAPEFRDVVYIDFFERERENASEQGECAADLDEDDDNELTKLSL